MTNRDFQDRLDRRARHAGVAVSADLLLKLEAYFRILALWNAKINLTGLELTDPTPETIDRLLIEPLVAAKHIAAGAALVMDVGSGGGSPAIPLVLAKPGLSLLMVESKTRKSVFLREVIRTIGLATAEVAAMRFEELLSHPDLHERHDLLTIRAVRIEARVLKGLQTFVKPGGHFFLFRGPNGADAPENVHHPMEWKATFPLIESLRSKLVVLEKKQIER